MSLTSREYLDWDVNSWKPALNYWKQLLGDGTSRKALELGANKGGLSLLLANHGFDVVCSDLKDAAANARPLHEKFSFSGNISYRDLDATQLPYENHFDIIIFKSILGGIGRNGRIDKIRDALFNIHQALKPGGMLLFAENLEASKFHQQLRKNFVKWGDTWYYMNRLELQIYLQPFSVFELYTTGLLGAFGRSETQRKVLAVTDKLLLNWWIPSAWKYIAYGSAIK